MMRGAALAISLLCPACASASEAYVQGIRTGMTLTEAERASSPSTGHCLNPWLGVQVADRFICQFEGKPSVALFLTTKGRVWLIRVALIGKDDDAEVKRRMIAAYDLKPDDLAKGTYANGSGMSFSFTRLAPDEVAFDISDVEVLKHDAMALPTPFPRF